MAGTKGLQVPAAAGRKHGLGTSYRTYMPEETLTRTVGLLSRIGATRIADITGLDFLGIPVVNVYRPNGRSLAVAQGKGLDLLTAKTSAVMEAIETWHAEFVQRPCFVAALAEVPSDFAVAPVDRLPRSSIGSFSEFRPIAWIEGRDVVSDRKCWVPYDLVHLDFTRPGIGSGSGFLVSSNGLASGNTVAEAVLHGLCEAIERDAQALAMALDPGGSLGACPEVEATTVVDPDCAALIRHLRDVGIGLRVWDITSDVGIACFECRLFEEDHCRRRLCRPVDGLGCHPDRGIALLRAIAEAAQSRLALISGARDDIDRSAYGYPLPGALRPAAAHRCLMDVPTFCGEVVEDDLQWVIGRVQAAGFRQVIAVDLSREDVGVPVVRVIVPGLESIPTSRYYRPGTRARERRRDRQ